RVRSRRRSWGKAVNSQELIPYCSLLVRSAHCLSQGLVHSLPRVNAINSDTYERNRLWLRFKSGTRVHFSDASRPAGHGGKIVGKAHRVKGFCNDSEGAEITELPSISGLNFGG